MVSIAPRVFSPENTSVEKYAISPSISSTGTQYLNIFDRTEPEFIKGLRTKVSAEGLSAGDDLDYFAGNRRLADSVHIEGERADHVTGVLLCRIHCGHSRTVLAGNRFKKRLVNLCLYVAG